MLKARIGLSCWDGRLGTMEEAHSHDDIEVNLCHVGRMTYDYAGTKAHISAGQRAVFWASRPHQLVDVDKDSLVSWLVIPIETFLAWPLNSVVREALVGGEILRGDTGPLDMGSFERWAKDLAHEGRSGSCQKSRADIALLEIEAWVRRVALDQRRVVLQAEAGPTDTAGRLAYYISEHYGERLSVERVARQIPLHPNYAMTLFQRSFGITMGSYLAQCRVAAAQRILTKSSASVSTVATMTGFTSQSAFYATFTKVTGMTPGSYRKGSGTIAAQGSAGRWAKLPELCETRKRSLKANKPAPRSAVRGEASLDE